MSKPVGPEWIEAREFWQQRVGVKLGFGQRLTQLVGKPVSVGPMIVGGPAKPQERLHITCDGVSFSLSLTKWDKWELQHATHGDRFVRLANAIKAELHGRKPKKGK